MPARVTVTLLQSAAVAQGLLDVSVAYTKLQASVSAQVLAAGVNAVVAKANVTAQILAADVYAAVIRVEAIVGEFIIERSFFDAATATDVDIIAFNKQLADVLASIDEVTALVGKSLSDAAVAVELMQRFTAKPLADFFATADGVDKTFTPANKQEFLAVADTTSVVPSKGFVDVANALEGPNRFQTYADPTYFAEDYTIDGSPRRDFFKVLAEAVDSTDDFLGAAVADDDQTISFAKACSTSIFVADPHAIAFTRPGVTDLFAAADVAAKNLSRPLADSGIISEVFDRVPIKGLLESVDAGDSGSLRMTDYTDINYFAQDYVGVSVSF
jgi:hypothetical protein